MHYMANNGSFHASAWQQDCVERNQRLTFAGAHAHFKNGTEKQRIGLLQ